MLTNILVAAAVVGGILGVTLVFLPPSLPTWAVGLSWGVAGGLVTAYRAAYRRKAD